MLTKIKECLKKYNYPPEYQKQAIDDVVGKQNTSRTMNEGYREQNKKQKLTGNLYGNRFLGSRIFQKNGFLRKLHHENRGAISLIFGVFHND